MGSAKTVQAAHVAQYDAIAHVQEEAEHVLDAEHIKARQMVGRGPRQPREEAVGGGHSVADTTRNRAGGVLENPAPLSAHSQLTQIIRDPGALLLVEYNALVKRAMKLEGVEFQVVQVPIDRAELIQLGHDLGVLVEAAEAKLRR